MNLNDCWQFLAYIGLFFLFTIIFNIFNAGRSLFRARQKLYLKYGSKNKKSWAVITGATDGIGKGFALVLSDYDFNICLISRTSEKLDTVAIEIKRRSPRVEVLCIQANFSEGNSIEFYEKINKQLQNLDIALLINNVGVRDKGPLELTDTAECINIITVNTFPQAIMTKILQKQMSTREQRSVRIPPLKIKYRKLPLA